MLMIVPLKLKAFGPKLMNWLGLELEITVDREPLFWIVIAGSVWPGSDGMRNSTSQRYPTYRTVSCRLLLTRMNWSSSQKSRHQRRVASVQARVTNELDRAVVRDERKRHRLAWSCHPPGQTRALRQAHAGKSLTEGVCLSRRCQKTLKDAWPHPTPVRSGHCKGKMDVGSAECMTWKQPRQNVGTGQEGQLPILCPLLRAAHPRSGPGIAQRSQSREYCLGREGNAVERSDRVSERLEAAHAGSAPDMTQSHSGDAQAEGGGTLLNHSGMVPCSRRAHMKSR
eukprot:1380287-Rhodomonas_salina.4